jgi:hypothetical protein
MRAILSLTFTTAISLIASHASARPVTTADLSGQKICWDNGSVDTFSAGGKYSSTGYGEGTWEVVSSGVEVHSARGSTIGVMDTPSRGIFNATYVNGGRTILRAGKSCK